MSDGEFSVVQFFADGSYQYVHRFVDAQEAVHVAKMITDNITAQVSAATRVIITDGGDDTVF